MSIMSEMIRCGRHKTEHPAENFSPSQRKPGGWCKQAYNDRYRGDVKHQEANRNARLKRIYGVDTAWYEAKLQEQGWVCAGCGKAQELDKPWMPVDHDHLSGRPRGVLCDNCNRAVGMVHDDPRVLRALADYLEAN